MDFDTVAAPTDFASCTGTGGLTFNYAIAEPSTLRVSDTFLTTSGTHPLGLDNSDTAFHLGDSFTINFNRAVHAVGLYLIAGSDAQAGDTQLSVAGGSVFNAVAPDTVLADGGRAVYLGLIESEIVSGVTLATLNMLLSPNAFLAVTADDIPGAVNAGSVVAEPGTRGPMLGGIGALAALRVGRRPPSCYATAAQPVSNRARAAAHSRG